MLSLHPNVGGVKKKEKEKDKEEDGVRLSLHQKVGGVKEEKEEEEEKSICTPMVPPLGTVDKSN